MRVSQCPMLEIDWRLEHCTIFERIDANLRSEGAETLHQAVMSRKAPHSAMSEVVFAMIMHTGRLEKLGTQLSLA